jgi:Holliday junction resolvase RusA-like endonuclease
LNLRNNIKEFGELYIRINREPVSLQAKPVKKVDFKDYVKQLINDIDVLFSGDVKLTITWHIHEELRYEKDSTADLDNIVKPLLDALSGKDGIMIDDNQVQAIDCLWLDSYQRDVQFLEVEVKSLLREDYIEKEDLYFINFDNLCLPISLKEKENRKEFLLECVSVWEMMINYRNKALEEGVSYYDAKGILPIQRIFHKSRILDFPIKIKEEIIELINNKKKE